MCEFCVKHGEGKKWYLNVKNYSDELLNEIDRYKFLKEKGFHWVNELYRSKFKLLNLLPLKLPIIGDIFRGVIKNWLLYEHWGQVVPIEDMEKILSFTNSITRIPCACQKIIMNRENRCCFLVSLDPSRIGIAEVVDQSFFGGPDLARFEKVNKKYAMDYLRNSETRGMIHTIWTAKAPFMGGFCNCDLALGCIPMKMYKKHAPMVFRAEYIAEVDKNSCIGCRECVKICQFDAIKIDNSTKKVSIDVKKCYGCGICRAVCKKNSISLKDRRLIPEVASLW